MLQEVLSETLVSLVSLGLGSKPHKLYFFELRGTHQKGVVQEVGIGPGPQALGSQHTVAQVHPAGQYIIPACPNPPHQDKRARHQGPC
jgi:hypothetical protein